MAEYTLDHFREDLRRVHRAGSTRLVRDAEETAVHRFDALIAQARQSAAEHGAAEGYRRGYWDSANGLPYDNPVTPREALS